MSESFFPDMIRLRSGGVAWREAELTPVEEMERRLADARDDADALALLDAEIDRLECTPPSEERRQQIDYLRAVVKTLGGVTQGALPACEVP